MGQVLCSTGAFIVRANGNDHNLLDVVAQRLHYDGYEFMMSSAWYGDIDKIASDVHRMGLYIPVLHSSKRIGEKISRNEEGDLDAALHCFRIDCQVAAFLKADKVVLHLWGGIQSDRNMEVILTAYPLLKSISDEYDLTLTLENVVCNQKDPITRLTELCQHFPDALFTFDTKMAAFHRQMDRIDSDENRWMWQENRTRHLHLNDYCGGYLDWKNLKTLHIGRGEIDFASFFDFLRRQNYKGDYTVEATSVSENGQIDLDSLNMSCRHIRDLLGKS